MQRQTDIQTDREAAAGRGTEIDEGNHDTERPEQSEEEGQTKRQKEKVRWPFLINVKVFPLIKGKTEKLRNILYKFAAFVGKQFKRIK